MTTVCIANNKSHFSPIDLLNRLTFRRGPSLENRQIEGTIAQLLVPNASELGSSKEVRDHFPVLSAQIEAWLRDSDLTLIVACVDPLKLNPFLPGYESLLAMLILAFPEVRWYFAAIVGYEVEEDRVEAKEPIRRNGLRNTFRKSHGLQQFLAPSHTALFDGAGLRDWVRQRMREHALTRDVTRYLPLRGEEQLAISLDEEIAYSHLHAYAAYRFGFRATAVTSAKVADCLLGKEGANQDPRLVFEDIFANYSDGRPGMSWLDVNPELGKEDESRSKAWPRLERAEYRIFVTSGQRIRGDELKWESNEAYIARQKTVQRITTLYKPYAGMFRIWQDSGLARQLKWTDGKGKTRRGTAKDFVWPPPRESFADNEHGHSSPGVLLVIAEWLIERASGLTDSKTIIDAIRGAVLATDALEILGCRTPTVAVEALRLKHYFEVLAECQFSGVEHHIHLEDRLKEIQRDVREISHWFGRKQRTTAALNAEMMILLCLVRLLCAHAQFDEEQYLMHRVRQLHNSLWLRQGLGGLRWRYIFWPFLRYSEFLLKSFSRFAVSIAAWISGLTAAFWYLRVQDHTLQDGKSLSPGWEAVSRAFSAFTGSDPLTVTGFFFPALTGFAVLAGLAHLGIFVSHLYTLVSRK